MTSKKVVRAVVLLAIAATSLAAGCGQGAATDQQAAIELTVQARVQATLTALTPESGPISTKEPAPTVPRAASSTRPTASPSPLPTATPRATAAPSPTPVPPMMKVVDTDGEGVTIRSTPGGEAIAAASEDALLAVVGQPRDQYGQRWMNVQDSYGVVGWVPSPYLEPVAATLPSPAAVATPTVTPTPSSTLAPKPAPTPRVGSYQLALESSSGGRNGDRVQVSGRVRNVGDSQLKGTVVVVEFRGSDDRTLSRREARLDTDPLLPGESASFTAAAEAGSEMSSYRIVFQQPGGGIIPTQYPPAGR